PFFPTTLPPPPSPTLFPYTTLFRSPDAGVTAERPQDNPVPAKPGEGSPIKHCIYIIKENRTYDQVLGDMKEGNGDPSLCLFPEKDRKSTRLNSSHVSISYAVFCLKK